MTVTLEKKLVFKRAYRKRHANQRDTVHRSIGVVLAYPSDARKPIFWHLARMRAFIVT